MERRDNGLDGQSLRWGRILEFDSPPSPPVSPPIPPSISLPVSTPQPKQTACVRAEGKQKPPFHCNKLKKKNANRRRERRARRDAEEIKDGIFNFAWIGLQGY
jgi:hypothetical protein